MTIETLDRRPFAPLWVALFLLVSSTSFAGITVNTSINDVWKRGQDELAGTISFAIDGDDFADASAETPIFIRITPDFDIKLAHTLVDQSHFDYRSDPLYLALSLTDGEDGVTLQADPTAVSIVQWIAGESAFWLKIQQSSSTWLHNGETAAAPSAGRSICRDSRRS